MPKFDEFQYCETLFGEEVLCPDRYRIAIRSYHLVSVSSANNAHSILSS